MWSQAAPVTDDGDTAAWLLSKALPPELVASQDLARVIRPDAALPRWATCRGQSWVSLGLRLVVRAWDATGEPVSLHARGLRTDGPKTLWPAGANARGLVFANERGATLLQGGAFRWDWTPEAAACDFDAALWILEGVSDFLTRCIGWQDGDAAGYLSDLCLVETAPAVWGIAAGALQPDEPGNLGERIPDGWTVATAFDPDAAGRAYEKKAAKLLGARALAGRLRLRRWTAPGPGVDYNDAFKARMKP